MPLGSLRTPPRSRLGASKTLPEGVSEPPKRLRGRSWALSNACMEGNFVPYNYIQASYCILSTSHNIYCDPSYAKSSFWISQTFRHRPLCIQAWYRKRTGHTLYTFTPHTIHFDSSYCIYASFISKHSQIKPIPPILREIHILIRSPHGVYFQTTCCMQSGLLLYAFRPPTLCIQTSYCTHFLLILNACSPRTHCQLSQKS